MSQHGPKLVGAGQTAPGWPPGRPPEVAPKMAAKDCTPTYMNMCVYIHIHTYIHTYTYILTYIYNYYYHAQMPASPAVPRNATCIHNTLQTRARNPMLSIVAVVRLGCWGLGDNTNIYGGGSVTRQGDRFRATVSPPCRVPKMARGLEAGEASRGGPGGHYEITQQAAGG